MDRGPICPAAGGPLCVCADYSSRYRRRTRRTASEGLTAAGSRLEKRMLAPRCGPSSRRARLEALTMECRAPAV